MGRLAMARPELSFRRAWALAYGVLWTFTLGSAAFVRVAPGGQALARQVLHLALTASHNPPPSLDGVVSIAFNNTLHSVWPLTLGLLGAQRRRFTRLLADVAVLSNLLLAAVLFGGAVGGYGVRVLPVPPPCSARVGGHRRWGRRLGDRAWARGWGEHTGRIRRAHRRRAVGGCLLCRRGAGLRGSCRGVRPASRMIAATDVGASRRRRRSHRACSPKDG